MLPITIVLIAIQLITEPYFSRLKGTGLWAGKAGMTKESSTFWPQGFSGALTNGWPNTLAAIPALIGLAILVIGSFHAWWFGAACAFGTLMITTNISLIYPLKVDYFLGVLVSRLQRRIKRLEMVGDQNHLVMTRQFEQKLQEMLAIYKGKRIRAPRKSTAIMAPFEDMYWLMNKDNNVD